MTLQEQASTNEAKKVVLGLGKALNDENFQIAREFVSEDMKYIGPFGVRDGAEAYLQEIQRLRLKFDIQKVLLMTKMFVCFITSRYQVSSYSHAAGFTLGMERLAR